MSEYKPGTVARVTWHGFPYTAIKGHPALWWGPGMGMKPVPTEELTDIRPLVVLDLSDYEANELASWLDGTDARMGVSDRLRVAREIRKQTKPPRIPEPGRYGVVRAKGCGLAECDWVNEGRYWTSLGGDPHSHTTLWSNLVDPVLIREGL